MNLRYGVQNPANTIALGGRATASASASAAVSTSISASTTTATSTEPDPGPPDTAKPVLTRSSALSLEAKHALGALLPLLDDPRLRDLTIQVVRGSVRIWVDRGNQMQELNGWRAPPSAVRALAVALISAGGRHIDELTPCADVRLGNGIRVHAILPPASVGGAAISIRVPRQEAMSFAALAHPGFCTVRQKNVLEHAVASKRNLLITGSTGSGKTTVLASLIDLVPSAERVITIEDVAELRLTHDHWVALEARQANLEGAGALSLERLLREALRMRPDRIVLGECRGAELLILLSALNTGHDGGAGTLHASSLHDVPARLEALGALGGLGPQALARQVSAAIHLVIHLERDQTGQHRLAALGRFAIQDDVLCIEEVV